jgi:acylphosphatase
MNNKVRAEIIAEGFVQGVGFRFFVFRHAQQLGLNGFTRNLATGEVETVVEGEKDLVQELFARIKNGPSHSSVAKAKITWSDYKNEFKNFDIRH